MRASKSQVRLASIIAIAVAVYAALAWWPLMRDIQRTRQQIATGEKELGITRGRTDGLAQLAHRVDQLRARSAMNNKDIPASAEVAGVLRQLSLEIEAASLTGQGISTRESQKRDEVIELPVELSFAGPSTAVFGFVERIENMPRLIQVDSMQIQRNADKGGTVDAAVRLRTFFSPGQEGRS